MDPNPVTTRDQFLACVAGTLVYGVLYLVMVVLLALNWHADWTVGILAVAAAGAAYLCFLVQMSLPAERHLAVVLILLSILFGIAAGVCLLAFKLAHG